MIHLRTLGSLELQGPGGATIHSVLTQPKRTALLVHLALAEGNGLVRRDTLLGLFWPELDEKHARNSLSKALHHLRRSLGEAVITTRGAEEVGVSREVVRCDAVLFRQGVAAGDLARALELYKGELLAGFFLPDAPGFERWLEGERWQLRAMASGAAAELADRHAAAGAIGPAVSAARRALSLEPHDESHLRRLVRVLERSGERAAALEAYEAFACSLAREYEIEPSAESMTLVESVRGGRGSAIPAPEAGSPQVPAAPVVERFDPASAPAPTTARPPPERAGGAGRPGFRPAAIGVLGLFVISIGIWAAGLLGRERGESRAPPEVDPDVVAVLPFRIGGADPSLAYLREGMVDLIAAKLTGEGGPRAVDSRSLVSAWRRSVGSEELDLPPDSALRLARSLGAGQLFVGEIVSTPGGLALSASHLGVARGEVRARASVDGPPDSLLSLVDHLVAQLLARGAGEDEQRLTALTTTSLPALRAYLAGQSAYRRGRYDEAVASFERALAFDSTFALAALGGILAAGWTSAPTDMWERAVGLRGRLSPRDQAILLAHTLRLPAPSFSGDQFEPIRRGVQAAPDQPEMWFRWGDVLFHWGSLHALPSAREHAAAAFRRSLELDSTFAGPLSHLPELAVLEGDTAGARRFRDLYLVRDSASDLAAFVRWRVAAALGDARELGRLRSELPRLHDQSLMRLVGVGQIDATGLEDVERAAAELRRRIPERPPRQAAMLIGQLARLALNRGRPAEAARLIDASELEQMVPGTAARLHALAGLYWDGDPGRARRAVQELAVRVDLPLADPSAHARAVRNADLCVLEQWRLWHGDAATARRTIDAVRASADRMQALCPVLLDALLAVTERQSRAPELLAGADAMARQVGTETDSWKFPLLYADAAPVDQYANLVLSRLWSMQGDHGSALDAVRRRPYQWAVTPAFHAAFLSEEGRLAALAGDTAGAVRAYRRYVALRAASEPALRPDVERARRALSALTGEIRR